ncbi:MAG: DUF4160 domain-containing protein [Gammaproteobacteria bacterium]|nr:DUF4160 domain-containing protein [Gammaproteobacteria bacterium]
MPVIFRDRGYNYFFYSNEGNPLEPCHIHVRKGDKIAKFLIIPEIKLVSAYGLPSKELSKIEKVIEKQKQLIEGHWNEYFSQ